MFPRTTVLLLFALALGSRSFADDGVDFFEKKVRPLLAERCLECHSPEKKIKAGLRLDIREGWAKGGDTGPAIVPGEPDKSLLITAIRYKDRDLQMPEKRKLPDEEIAILEQWVKMGAPDPRTGSGGEVVKKQKGLSIEEGKKFWCYTPLQKPAVPAVKDTTWARGGSDPFILAKIEAAGLQPAPDATPETLVRRACYVLTGLPPTPEQVETFVHRAANTSLDQALASLVDELLASPRFGEAWGRHWLDVARFAESSGGGRTLLFKDAWRYRDYVIEAFNSGMPFDQFIREQIAGDLLPAADFNEKRREVTATAFLALGPTNYEEQDKQQLRFDVIDEQLETLGRSFLGQTIGCARCHDHKFDPIPQRDYYAMAGILASTRTLLNYKENVARWIAAPLPCDGPAEAALQAQEQKIAALEKDLVTAKAALAEASKGVTQGTGEPGQPVKVSDLPGLVIDDTEAKVVGYWKHSTHTKSYIGEGYLTDDNTGKGEKTVTFTPTVAQSGRYDVRLAYSYLGDRSDHVKVTVFHADGEDTIYVDETQVPPIDGRFISLGKFRFEKNGAGFVLISNENTTKFVTVDALQLIPETEAIAAAAKDEVLSPVRNAAAKNVKRIEEELKAAKHDGPVRETTMAVHDDAEQIADTQIRVRGVEKQRGDTVPRGFLHVALKNEPALSEGESGRRELAAWIASPENPLTARVFVNRVWTWLFGAGIVRTVDNFGTTGERPSHAELLDYLASRFVAEGWNVKQLIREIILSRAWREAADNAGLPNHRFKTVDPENRLFARANRRRLDAEQIRDTLLAVSGQLRLDYLGPNITGAGDIDPNNFSAQNIEYGYVFSDTRRSVYTPAFRNKRLELFEAFDFGDINSTMGQRNVSTVAPQALYFLNHPFVIEQARASAERTLVLEGSIDERVEAAFRRTLSRAPSATELEKCRRFLGASPTADSWIELHQMLFACLDFRYLD